MYGIIYTSSQYYDNNTQLDPLVELEDSNKECIICWLPSNKDIPVKSMKEYLYFNSNCKCNVYFHDNCFKTWLTKESSCPICRKKISVNINVNIIENEGTYIKITTYTVIFLNYTVYFLKMLSFFSLINLLCIIFYTIIFFDFTLDSYHDECKADF